MITYRIGNRVYYWVWLRPDRLICRNTHTNTNTNTQGENGGGRENSDNNRKGPGGERERLVTYEEVIEMGRKAGDDNE